MRIDLGRALLTRAHLERRRRRAAAARAALRGAETCSRSCTPRRGSTQVRRSSPAAAAPRSPAARPLTDTEARVAGRGRPGASNREIAERLYVSVKTVEATLTRIYRKLDVRSRTQLAALTPCPWSARSTDVSAARTSSKGFPLPLDPASS